VSTAAKTAPAEFFTGFCGLRLPEVSHQRCPRLLRVADGVQTCACPCHTSPAPDPAAGSPARPVLISGTGGVESTDDLGEGLHSLEGAVATIDRAILTFDGSDVEVLDLLGRLRAQRQYLAQIESLVEGRAVRAMAQDVVVWDGGTAERRWGKTRKEWKHDDLVRAVAVRITEQHAVDTTTGTLDEALSHTLLEALTEFAATHRPDWRVTAVRPLGIDPDEFCTSVPGRATVQVTLAGATS
jgi:hypothetical protein